MNDYKLVSSVTKELRNAILTGLLKEGDHIVQNEWAEKLNVSRMPIREALFKLQVEGLVDIIPHKGAVVTSITYDDLEELYYIRGKLEGIVVEKSLPFMSTQDKEELKNIYQQMSSINEQSDGAHSESTYEELHHQFHTKLRERCPWQRTVKIVEQLSTAASMAPEILGDYRESIQEEHKRILEAVLINDPFELKAALEYHVQRTKNNLINYLKTKRENNL